MDLDFLTIFLTFNFIANKFDLIWTLSESFLKSDGDASKPEEEVGDDVSTIDDTAHLEDDSTLGGNDSDSQRILSISDKQKPIKSAEKKRKK